jgi:putative phosphoserine phosphatase/1-acylglycerol-3-phosphate O-acyltransferase
MKAIADLLPPEARTKRTPTDEELALTYPHGKIPDAGTDEHERRPGSD